MDEGLMNKDCKYFVPNFCNYGETEGLCRNPEVGWNHCYGMCAHFQTMYDKVEKMNKTVEEWIESENSLAMQIREAVMRAQFEQALCEGIVIDNYAIVAHPKHKKAISDSSINLPVWYNKNIEEDKTYVITDPDIVKIIKEAIDYKEEI